MRIRSPLHRLAPVVLLCGLAAALGGCVAYPAGYGPYYGYGYGYGYPYGYAYPATVSVGWGGGWGWHHGGWGGWGWHH